MVNETKTSNLPSAKGHPSHRWKQICLQIIVGMVILFCGIVIGSGAALLHLKDRMIMPGPRPPLNAIVEDIRARYDLTQEQAVQVEDLFGKRRETLQTLFQEFRRKTEAEFQKLSVEMKKILSPEQYERWERDFKDRRGRWPGRHRPERPGPGRPGQRRPGFGRPGLREPILPEPNSIPD